MAANCFLCISHNSSKLGGTSFPPTCCTILRKSTQSLSENSNISANALFSRTLRNSFFCFNIFSSKPPLPKYRLLHLLCGSPSFAPLLVSHLCQSLAAYAHFLHDRVPYAKAEHDVETSLASLFPLTQPQNHKLDY